jgi:hypothetical protein
MLYHEYAHSPEKRNGTMVPRSAALDFYNRVDSGYFSVYLFDEAAAFAIRAQGDSTGLSRFPVHSDRLWVDFDASDNSPQEVERVKAYVREVTRQLQALDYNFTVWDSGSKGFHIAIKIDPMQGKDVPWSQGQYVQNTLKLTCDLSLYQHGRLLSNPGRVHPKTGRRKTKVYEHRGSTILFIPMLVAPKKLDVDSDSLTDADLGRIGFQRLASFIQDTPLAGMRHTKLWSLASGLFEAGMSRDLVSMNCLYVNKFLPDPKPEEEVLRAVNQAANQLGIE